MTQDGSQDSNTPKNEIYRIILVSDGTGETASQMVKAAMVQFPGGARTFMTRFKNVRTEVQIDAICEDAKSSGSLVVFTIVSSKLRAYLIDKSEQMMVPCVDLLGPILIGLASYYGHKPMSVAGLLHDVNEQYFKRIEAMEYTIAHDDGKNLNGLDKADIIILGISRTSKTPLSMYLSHQGLRVVNIPIISGFELPKELIAVDQKKIIGLTIDPEDLAKIRRARLQRLGQDKGGDYADIERVNEEIEYANVFFKKNRRWPVFNVTGKALEETASEILKMLSSRRINEAALRATPPKPIPTNSPISIDQYREKKGLKTSENVKKKPPKRAVKKKTKKKKKVKKTASKTKKKSKKKRH